MQSHLNTFNFTFTVVAAIITWRYAVSADCIMVLEETEREEVDEKVWVGAYVSFVNLKVSYC